MYAKMDRRTLPVERQRISGWHLFLHYFTAAWAWNSLTLLSQIITKVPVSKDQAPCLNCQSWSWCLDSFFWSQASSFPIPFCEGHTEQQWQPRFTTFLWFPGDRGAGGFGYVMPGYPAVPSALRIFVGLQIPPPPKHAVLHWQEAAGSDSVLLSVEIIGICVWVLSACWLPQALQRLLLSSESTPFTSTSQQHRLLQQIICAVKRQFYAVTSYSRSPTPQGTERRKKKGREGENKKSINPQTRKLSSPLWWPFQRLCFKSSKLMISAWDTDSVETMGLLQIQCN